MRNRGGFWAKVEVHVDGCWLWFGATTRNGYGVWREPGGRQRMAHHLPLAQLGVVVPAGRQTDHLCRVRNCVRPDHLEVVTPRVNTRRGVGPAALNAVKTCCPQGHPYDETNTVPTVDGGRRCRTCRNARNRAA